MDIRTRRAIYYLTFGAVMFVPLLIVVGISWAALPSPRSTPRELRRLIGRRPGVALIAFEPNPEAAARVAAWFARNLRPRGV